MKNKLFSIVFLGLLACGCSLSQEVESTPPVLTDNPKAKFIVGDEVILSLPDGVTTIEGEITLVGNMEVFVMPDGSTKTSRAYLIRATIERQLPEDGVMVLVIETPAPEFALTLKRRINER